MYLVCTYDNYESGSLQPCLLGFRHTSCLNCGPAVVRAHCIRRPLCPGGVGMLTVSMRRKPFVHLPALCVRSSIDAETAESGTVPAPCRYLHTRSKYERAHSPASRNV